MVLGERPSYGTHPHHSLVRQLQQEQDSSQREVTQISQAQQNSNTGLCDWVGLLFTCIAN